MIRGLDIPAYLWLLYHVSLSTHLFKPHAGDDDLFLDVLNYNRKNAFYILQK